MVVLLTATIIHRQIVTKDASAQTVPYNMTANAFASMIVRVYCVAKHSKLDTQSKAIVILASAKRVYGSVRMKHVVHDVQRLAIHIMKLLMANVSILWENVHIIY